MFPPCPQQGEYSALPGAGHFWPQRPDNLFLYAAGGHISVNSERNMEKNAAKNQRFLDFPCPIPTTVQKGSASNRLYPHPRCRSHAPRGGAPVCYRAAGLLRPYRRFPEYRRSLIDAPRRGRRSRRPVAFLFPHASGEGYSAPRARATFGRSGPTTFFSMPPAAIFLSTAKEIWKRTPPKTRGFWISLVRFQPRYKKVPHRIACTPIPAAAPAYHAATRRFIGFAAAC